VERPENKRELCATRPMHYGPMSQSCSGLSAPCPCAWSRRNPYSRDTPCTTCSSIWPIKA
jgi:hypothetical protein